MTQSQENYIKSLQQEIEQRDKDVKALQQELRKPESENAPATTIKNALVSEVPTYIRNINDLAIAAESESVRLQANKLLIEWAITERLATGAADADDNFKALIKELRRK